MKTPQHQHLQQLVCVCDLDCRFPLALSTLYTGKARGRYNWITRRGKRLWIDPSGFNEWAAQQGGMKFRFDVESKSTTGGALKQH